MVPGGTGLEKKGLQDIRFPVELGRVPPGTGTLRSKRGFKWKQIPWESKSG
jgi:hypothetical protein